MNYYSSLLLFIIGLSVISLFFYLLFIFYKSVQIKKIQNLPFKNEYVKILKQIPFYNKLSSEEKEKIHQSILIFINTKDFIGVRTDITDEMKIVIAFYACLLILHVNIDGCYDNLKTIIIYQNTILTKQESMNGGIYTKTDFLIEGQSANDTVVVSWHEAKKEAYHIQNNNVVIHEFAHEIDFMNGAVNGTPPLAYSKYHEWAMVLSKEFNTLQKVSLKNRYWGKYKFIGDYAATNEAEFFAVITERFFENPISLKDGFPDLYKELESFYKRGPILDV